MCDINNIYNVLKSQEHAIIIIKINDNSTYAAYFTIKWRLLLFSTCSKKQFEPITFYQVPSYLLLTIMCVPTLIVVTAPMLYSLNYKVEKAFK